MNKVLLVVGVLVLFYLLSQEGGTVTNSSELEKWALAIQQFEGWTPGSMSYRNNNPGNLRDSSGNERSFATYQDGFDALVADLSAKVSLYPGYSLLQIMTRYLGGDPNNPQVTAQGDPFTYAQYVANQLGASIDDTLSKIFGG